MCLVPTGGTFCPNGWDNAFSISLHCLYVCHRETTTLVTYTTFTVTYTTFTVAYTTFTVSYTTFLPHYQLVTR